MDINLKYIEINELNWIKNTPKIELDLSEFINKSFKDKEDILVEVAVKTKTNINEIEEMYGEIVEDKFKHILHETTKREVACDLDQVFIQKFFSRMNNGSWGPWHGTIRNGKIYIFNWDKKHVKIYLCPEMLQEDTLSSNWEKYCFKVNKNVYSELINIKNLNINFICPGEILIDKKYNKINLKGEVKKVNKEVFKNIIKQLKLEHYLNKLKK
jgi:hypothetical protein